MVTALYPLAQAAEQIGRDKAAVTDVVPTGANPLQYQLSAGQVAAVRSAGLAVGVGGGFQPSFAAAAEGARSVLLLPPPAGGDPYLWLDPASMGRAVSVLVMAMAKADPPAAALFRRNASSLQAQISSLGIDYSSILTACPYNVLITPDRAFTTMAKSYGLQSVVVGAGSPPSTVSTATATVTAGHARAVASEPWVDDSGVRAVATAAHVALRPLDTLVGAPGGGWPPGANYFALMEQDLAGLSAILACPPPSQ